MTLQLSDPLATPKIPTWIDDVEASDATFGIVTRRLFAKDQTLKGLRIHRIRTFGVSDLQHFSKL